MPAAVSSHEEPAIQTTDLGLTPYEISLLKELLHQYQHHHNNDLQSTLQTVMSTDSDYPEYPESTHAWAVFADNPKKRAGTGERLIGTMIILFQLFAYRLFASEAIEDFQSATVPVVVTHQHCLENDEIPAQEYLQCEAEYTNTIDAFVSFFMLGIFLTGDVLQALRAIRDAPWGTPMIFAALAGLEVVCAFCAAGVAVSYNLFIGEITDAVAVGVGLLFIRELSQRTYTGLRHGKRKQYRNFFIVLGILVSLGMIMDPLCAKLFAGYIQ